MVRVGIRTKGCSGQQYDLQYTTKKEKFDEEVKQDGKKNVKRQEPSHDCEANWTAD